jgi:hypothetical protein
MVVLEANAVILAAAWHSGGPLDSGFFGRASAAVRVTTLSSHIEQSELSASPRKPNVDKVARSPNALS